MQVQKVKSRNSRMPWIEDMASASGAGAAPLTDLTDLVAQDL